MEQIVSLDYQIEKLAEMIQKDTEDCHSPTRRRAIIASHLEKETLQQFPYTISKITEKVTNMFEGTRPIDKGYHTNKLMRFIKHNNVEDIVTGLLTATVNDSTTKYNYPVQLIISKIIPSIKGFVLNETKASAECALELLYLCKGCGWYEMFTNSNGHLMVTLSVALPIECSEELKSLMYLPPLITKPKHIYNNYDSGYLTVKGKSKVFKPVTNLNRKISLDVLNEVNSIPLSINTDILQYPMKPKNPVNLKNVKQFLAFREQAYAVYEYIIGTGNVFYNDHGFEFRGRLLSLGYWLHIQSMPYIKALVTFKNPSEIPLD